MNAIKTTLLSILAAVTAFGATAAPISVPSLPASMASLSFVVLRNGEQVGSHLIAFETKGATTSVDIQTDIVVKMVMIPVYRFEHKGHETWKDGRLISLTSATNDDGNALKLQVISSGDGLDVRSSLVSETAPADSIPGSLWTQTAMTQTHLLNSLNGKQMSISVTDLGETRLQIHDQPVLAHHFTVDGDLKRDVWYGAGGTLVQMAFKGKDGSDILYRLR